MHGQLHCFHWIKLCQVVVQARCQKVSWPRGLRRKCLHSQRLPLRLPRSFVRTVAFGRVERCWQLVSLNRHSILQRPLWSLAEEFVQGLRPQVMSPLLGHQDTHTGAELRRTP